MYLVKGNSRDAHSHTTPFPESLEVWETYVPRPWGPWRKPSSWEPLIGEMIKVYIIESSNAAAIAAAGDGSQSRLQVGLHWFQMVFGYFGGVFLFFPLFFACVFVFPLNSGVSLTFSWTHSVIHFFDPTWFPIQNEQWKKGIILPYMGIVSEAIYKFPYKQPGFPMESICKARTPRFFLNAGDLLSTWPSPAVTGGLPTA